MDSVYGGSSDLYSGVNTQLISKDITSFLQKKLKGKEVNYGFLSNANTHTKNLHFSKISFKEIEGFWTQKEGLEIQFETTFEITHFIERINFLKMSNKEIVAFMTKYINARIHNIVKGVFCDGKDNESSGVFGKYSIRSIIEFGKIIEVVHRSIKNQVKRKHKLADNDFYVDILKNEYLIVYPISIEAYNIDYDSDFDIEHEGDNVYMLHFKDKGFTFNIEICASIGYDTFIEYNK